MGVLLALLNNIRSTRVHLCNLIIVYFIPLVPGVPSLFLCELDLSEGVGGHWGGHGDPGSLGAVPVLIGHIVDGHEVSLGGGEPVGVPESTYCGMESV